MDGHRIGNSTLTLCLCACVCAQLPVFRISQNNSFTFASHETPSLMWVTCTGDAETSSPSIPPSSKGHLTPSQMPLRSCVFRVSQHKSKGRHPLVTAEQGSPGTNMCPGVHIPMCMFERNGQRRRPKHKPEDAGWPQWRGYKDNLVSRENRHYPAIPRLRKFLKDLHKSKMQSSLGKSSAHWEGSQEPAVEDKAQRSGKNHDWLMLLLLRTILCWVTLRSLL